MPGIVKVQCSKDNVKVELDANEVHCKLLGVSWLASCHIKVYRILFVSCVFDFICSLPSNKTILVAAQRLRPRADFGEESVEEMIQLRLVTKDVTNMQPCEKYLIESVHRRDTNFLCSDMISVTYMREP